MWVGGCKGVATDDRGLGNPLPAVQSGRGHWGPAGLQLQIKLWPMAMELGVMGGVGRPEEVAVYYGRERE